MNKKLAKMERKLRNLALRVRLKNKDFTLLCQNCVGGVIYSFLGLPFRSPTINMFIEDENFVKLAENPGHYLSLKAMPYCERYVDPVDPSIAYPQILVGDLVMNCIHYKSATEAACAWNRRCARVNPDNIFILGNSWNCHENYDLVRRLARLKNAVVFTYEDLGIEHCIPLDKSLFHLDERGIARPNLTDEKEGSVLRLFETMFDYVAWLNAGA